MAGFKIGQKLCFICNAPLEPHVRPCKRCGQYYHRSGNCTIIHSRACLAKSRDNLLEEVQKPFSDIHKPKNDRFLQYIDAELQMALDKMTPYSQFDAVGKMFRKIVDLTKK